MAAMIKQVKQKKKIKLHQSAKDTLLIISCWIVIMAVVTVVMILT
ncbi:hypothetical protein ABTQ33_02655 [Paucilactobacillus suebicus]|nr:hypothetical protein [Paucilactobacillus suebicus]